MWMVIRTHCIKMSQCYHDLKNSLQHLDIIIDRQISEQVAKNRLQLQVSIDDAKWCVYQAAAFRAQYESVKSSNRDNFFELKKHTASYDKDVIRVVLRNAP
ncbi:hypothetical protein ACH5RR_025895 [Cinchona calisaya]|uniref:DUF4371 domain-containing protein n=1 Tax=Cinchona calisaya TaxID=153742 RepID=A0ABD2Z0Y4_9GENT